MGQAVDHGSDQDLVIDNLVPAVESEVCCDDGGLFVRTQRKMVEEHLGSGLVARDISELVTYHHVVSLEPILQ